MKGKLLNLGLIFTSLLGYLEWGESNLVFMISTELEILSKLFTDPASVLHPFVLLPLFGQALLVVTLFQKSPGRGLTYTGLLRVGFLLLFMFLIGVIGLNFKIIFSTLLFLFLSVVTVRYHQAIRSGPAD